MILGWTGWCWVRHDWRVGVPPMFRAGVRWCVRCGRREPRAAPEVAAVRPPRRDRGDRITDWGWEE